MTRYNRARQQMRSHVCQQLEASMTDAGIDPGTAPSGDGS
jgi:hypothetical protein